MQQPLGRRTIPAPLRRPAAGGSPYDGVIRVCAILFLTIVLAGTTPLQQIQTGSAIGEGNTANQVMHVGIFLTLVFATGMRNMRGLFCVPAGVTVLIGYCYLTTLWAIAPDIAVRRATITAIGVWVTFRIVRDLGPDRTLRLLRQIALVVLVINFLVVLFTPYGVHSNSLGEEEPLIGNWRGMLSHKNIAGSVCALTILLYLFDNRQFSRLVSAMVVVAAAVFLYFTQSKTSQGVLALALLAGFAIRPFSTNNRLVIGVFLFIVAGLSFLFVSTNIEALDDILNDPNALTGRLSIWPLLLQYAAAHPWTGAGFGSFWRIGDASPIWTLTSGWVALYGSHGHNGYLDLLVTIGVPGLALAIVTLILWPLARLLFSVSVSRPRRSLLLAIMVFCIGHNMTESTLMNATAVVQIMMMVAVAIIYRESQASVGVHHAIRRRVLRLFGRRGAPRGAAMPLARPRAQRGG